jgi:hypothetical protein
MKMKSYQLDKTNKVENKSKDCHCSSDAEIDVEESKAI